jgi:DnaJ like chaperone protein
VRDNHPDRELARGLPPEAVKIATERLAAINAAHDRIQALRAGAARRSLTAS